MESYEEKKYKHLFLTTLEPFLDFLEAQQEEMTVGNWLEVVHRTQIRITVNPEQYLGRDLPTTEDITKIINEIFDEFMSDHVKEPMETSLTY
jgi:hypothetical protein